MKAFFSAVLVLYLFGGGGAFASAHKLESSKANSDGPNSFPFEQYDKGNRNYRLVFILTQLFPQRF
jgi:hypothetical protein